MVRFFVNLLLVCAAAVAISMQDGTVLLELPGRSIEFDLQTGLALALIFLVWWWGIAKLWFFIKYGFSRRHEKQLRLRQQQGLQLLTHSLNDLAAGNLRRAHKALKKSRRLLGEAPLALWLEAELASRRGEAMAAHKIYQQLAATPEGSVLGWRGLLQQQPDFVKQKGAAEVLRLTGEALAVSDIAQQDFAHELRIMAYAQQGNWPEAILALHAAVRAKALAKPRAQKLNVVLGLMHARNLSSHGLPADSDTELRQLKQAYKDMPAFVPVACAYAAKLAASGDISLANKVVAAVWLVAPHLDVLKTFNDINEGQEALALLQRFERFALKRKDHPASHVALAQLSLAARIAGKARSHAESALALRPVREALLLRADIADIELEPASDYERAAAGAPPLGLYVCESCNYAAPVWQAVCPHCARVATMDWEEELDKKLLPLVGVEAPKLIA